jgi:WD40 repeat protein
MAFSPDGKTLAGGVFGHGLYLWQVDTGALRQILETDIPVWDLAFSPQGAHLGAGTDAGLQMWPVGDETALEMPDQPPGSILSVAFSPDGDLVVGGTREGQVYIWETETGRLTITEFGHSGTESTQ